MTDLTLTTTGTTGLTLPAGTHTVAVLDVSQTWTAEQIINFTGSNQALVVSKNASASPNVPSAFMASFIGGDSQATVLDVVSFGVTAKMALQRADGTGAPAGTLAIQAAGEDLGTFAAGGFDGTTWQANGALTFQAAQGPFTSSNLGTRLIIRLTPLSSGKHPPGDSTVWPGRRFRRRDRHRCASWHH